MKCDIFVHKFLFFFFKSKAFADVFVSDAARAEKPQEEADSSGSAACEEGDNEEEEEEGAVASHHVSHVGGGRALTAAVQSDLRALQCHSAFFFPPLTHAALCLTTAAAPPSHPQPSLASIAKLRNGKLWH